LRSPRSPHPLGAAILVATLATLAALTAPVPAPATLPSPADFTVLADSADFVTLRWGAVDDSTLVGYRVLVSQTAGVHPLQTSWNGFAAAFSWTTDDSRPDNLIWAEAAAASGYKFTIFTISGLLGQPGFLTVAQLNALHAQGHEIAGHSVKHPFLTTDAAMRLAYVGASVSCTVSITNGMLRTYLGIIPDLTVSLTNPGVFYLDGLVAYLDALTDYECTLENYAIHTESTESRWLDPIFLPGASIKPGSALLTTRKGCNPAELANEVAGCKAELESLITDTTFACETFSYPFHMHDQREMKAVMAAGYIGARDGYYGFRPSGSPVDVDVVNRVDLYEKPQTLVTWSNGSSETGTRTLVQSYIASIKTDGDWGHPRTAHFLSDLDSLHLTWMFDELENDGGVWVATFGEVAAYARQFGISVSNPRVPGSDPADCRVTLGGFDPAAAHYAVVVAYDAAGEASAWSNEVMWGSVTAVGPPGRDAGAAPTGPIVVSAWPNPSRGASRFAFSLAGRTNVWLALYDPSGRLVRRLVDARLDAGPHVAAWDGADERGRRVPPGVYLYELAAPAVAPTRGKIQVLR